MKYKCAICDKEYNSISERNQCETRCLNRFKHNERQKADTFRLNLLFKDYIESLISLQELTTTINGELERYKGSYNMLYASSGVIDKLHSIIGTDNIDNNMASFLPAIVISNSKLFAYDSDKDLFSVYKKYNKSSSDIIDTESQASTTESNDTDKRTVKVKTIKINYHHDNL